MFIPLSPNKFLPNWFSILIQILVDTVNFAWIACKVEFLYQAISAQLASTYQQEKWRSSYETNKLIGDWRRIFSGELRPIDILVYDDFAIIHYFYIEVTKDKDGEEDYGQGRWTDIMIREKGKWPWIADHGGSRPD